MQKEQSALLVHRENYEVPKGQEQSVHYRIAKLDSKGNFLEPARICHDEPKLFDTVLKHNLETLGYTVEILHHPLGKFTDVKIMDKEALLKAKDEEIAALKAKMQSGGDASEVETLKAEAEKAKAEAEAEIEKFKAEVEKAKAEAEKAKAEAAKAKEELKAAKANAKGGKGGNKSDK